MKIIPDYIMNPSHDSDYQGKRIKSVTYSAIMAVSCIIGTIIVGISVVIMKFL